ncbi:MAG: secondary thiamine-phosphate synthase enzyme YjbQ [Tissierellia bacterium]|nr:secondary thiamine-phosphate synthase enzyme YjbQ [Tissierellia bacterium]
MYLEKLRLKTHAKDEMIDITKDIENAIVKSQIKDGLAIVFCPHTTAAITINENADPDVCTDFIRGLDSISPDWADFKHAEGNSAAHIKSSLIGASETVIVENGRPVLGRWQGIYFAEFDGPRFREFYVKVI